MRIKYYSLLESEYLNHDIPIIVSHGAVNGYPSVYNNSRKNDENGPFWGRDINFYDDEIINIARSHGIFGIQLDDRLIANEVNEKKSNIQISAKIKSCHCGPNLSGITYNI